MSLSKDDGHDRRIGIITLNLYGAFTNYGSMLQSWALQKILSERFPKIDFIVVDYVPSFLQNVNILDPLSHLESYDSFFEDNCRGSYDDIAVNYRKFERFFKEEFHKTDMKYTSAEIMTDDLLNQFDGFIIGGDTVFYVNECGFDPCFYAQIRPLKGRSVSISASFADMIFDDATVERLKTLLTNFKYLGIRESDSIARLKDITNVPIGRILDPTLMLDADDYDGITSPSLIKEKYLLFYSRGYNPEMYKEAREVCRKKSLRFIEISLIKTNSEDHPVLYCAGIEEFLSLIKYSDYVVTNSYHGMIFAMQNRKPFSIFSRKRAVNKINELLKWLNISTSDGLKNTFDYMDYDAVWNRIKEIRADVFKIIDEEINILLEGSN